MTDPKDSSLWQSIEHAIYDATGTRFLRRALTTIGGGCINSAYCLEGANVSYFIKLNQAKLIGMFEAEYVALSDLAKNESVKVPLPICFGSSENKAFIVLEYIDLHSSNGKSDDLLGRQLAALHQTKQSMFGWNMENTIGSTPQPNPATENWVTFFTDSRLRHQLNLADLKGFSGQIQQNGAALCENMGLFFDSYTPYPSLLHGDLWGGNYATDNTGHPVIFDPASYYGDREADIAMTELFGGFSPAFYTAYNKVFPLDPGYSTRKTLYNLYHILNHLNLFGGSYLAQAERMIEMLLAEM